MIAFNAFEDDDDDVSLAQSLEKHFKYALHLHNLVEQTSVTSDLEIFIESMMYGVKERYHPNCQIKMDVTYTVPAGSKEEYIAKLTRDSCDDQQQPSTSQQP